MDVHFIQWRPGLEQFAILDYELILPMYSDQVRLKVCTHIGLNKK